MHVGSSRHATVFSLCAVTIAALSALLSGCDPTPPKQAEPIGAPAADAALTGRDACAGCHLQEYRSWQGSHHDLAMQVAGLDTVLGNFDNVSYDHFGLTSRFYRLGDDYRVETDNEDGHLESFRIAYTFGVYPLQQYLVEFPNGRLQALGIGWDARPAAEGGQRWFHLYPDQPVRHDDPLHWTGRAQKLEQYVRGMPLDKSAEKLFGGNRYVQVDLG